MKIFALPILIAMSLGVIMGVVRPARVVRYLIMLTIGPTLAAVGRGLAQDTFAQSSVGTQAAMVVCAPFAAILLLLLWLPRSIRTHMVASAAYDVVRWLVLLPFRIVYAAVVAVARR